MSDTPITVPEFMKVRRHIASLLRENSSTQEPTRIRQAENLLAAGVIDVPAVLEALSPQIEADDEGEPVQGEPIEAE